MNLLIHPWRQIRFWIVVIFEISLILYMETKGPVFYLIWTVVGVLLTLIILVRSGGTSQEKPDYEARKRWSGEISRAETGPGLPVREVLPPWCLFDIINLVLYMATQY